MPYSFYFNYLRGLTNFSFHGMNNLKEFAED